LSNKLDAPELVQLMQRVRLRFHLGTLDADEMRDYIRHRLDVAGADGREIFAADTFERIYRTTTGVPRLINTLCDTAMLAAFAEGRDHVTSADITASIHELGWDLRPPAQARAAAAANAAAGADAAASGGPAAGALEASLIAQLVLSTEGSLAREIPLRPGRILIGRTPENDVQIDSHFVSRHHCQVTTSAGGSVIEDLNSTNGLRVRGRRVRRHELMDGDVVAIGQHELKYVDMRFAQRREAATAGHHESTGSTMLHPPLHAHPDLSASMPEIRPEAPRDALPESLQKSVPEIMPAPIKPVPAPHPEEAGDAEGAVDADAPVVKENSAG